MVEKLEIIRCDKCRGKITPNPVSFHYEVQAKKRSSIHLCERCLGVLAYRLLETKKITYGDVMHFISSK